MERYGVKLKTGKVLWVRAEAVDVHDGVVLFLAGHGERRHVLAGFAVAGLDHFGLPEAFVSTEEAEP